MKNALTFVRAYAVTFTWSATLLFVSLAAVIWPGLTWLAFVLEVAVVAAAWIALFEWRTILTTRRRDDMRAERDEAREMVNALMELVHQHHLATIKDRDCGPDAYGRAAELADQVRSIRFPDLYARRSA